MISPLPAERFLVAVRVRNGGGTRPRTKRLIAVALAALAITSALAQPVGKYGELSDRYGNPSRALSEMMAAQSAKTSKSSGSSYNPPEGESPFAGWARGLQAKAEAEANAQRAAQAKKESEVRSILEYWASQERIALGVARREKEAEAAKALDRAKAAELHEKRFGDFIRKSQSFLQAFRTGKPFPAERSREVADAMLIGVFEWKDGWDNKRTKIADLGITCTPAERFAVAIEIYRQRSTGDYEHWLAEAAYALSDRVRLAIQGAGDSDRSIGSKANAVPSDWHWAGLVSALAESKSRLSEDQRQQATALLTEIIQGLPAAADADGLARACLLVAAARQTPALAEIERLQSVFVPQVAGSVWAAGFPTMPARTTGGDDSGPCAVVGIGGETHPRDGERLFELSGKVVFSDQGSSPAWRFGGGLPADQDLSPTRARRLLVPERSIADAAPRATAGI